MRYNNPHKHTMYSNVMTPDSIIKPIDYANRAKELGHTTISTVEHGYAGNVFEYYEVAKANDLKFIFGIEYYYVNNRFEKDRSNSHLLVLAKNQNGMKQMQKIMSESNKTGSYYKPRIDKELLLSLNPKDVVVTTACTGSYINRFEDHEDNFVIPLLRHFGENFYLEVQDNVHHEQMKYNKLLLELSNKYGIPLFHACDTHYIRPEDSKWRDLYLKGRNIFYPEEDGYVLDYPDSETIFKRYEKQGVLSRQQVESALKNTWILDDFDDIVLDKDTIKMPTIYPNLNHQEKMKKLKNIITEEWIKDREHIPQERYKEYLDAIRFETQIIDDTQMEDYFLLNNKIVKKATEEKGGILTRTGRGSAPSYYINKLLGFTEIDRLEAPITLYPTRFISTSRILETKSLPDIDFNTSNPEPFIEAAKEILGEDNVYYMTAYGTAKDSEAFRIYCRAKEMKMDEYNEVAKNLDFYRNDPKWKDIIEESKHFIDVVNSVSPHPCAFLLLDKPISEEIGLLRVGDQLCALVDSKTSDAWKYLKNDFLTVTVWTIISETFKMIGKPILNIRELTKAIENDERVWDLYNKGLTATLNQTGTESGRPQVMLYKPRNIRELSAWVSAIRPQFESMKRIFLNREKFSYGIPEFDKILEESDNFILYQENLMAVLVYVGFPEDQTYGLLKAISKKKKGIIEPIQEKFMNGFIEKTGSKENAERVWKIIEDAVGYGFNSSHAYSVALDSAYGGYLKVNYPHEYFTVVLNLYADDVEMTSKILSELPHFNLKIGSIKFRKSRSNYSFDKENNVLFKGIASIKYLNEQVAEDLYELRNNQYETFVDLLVDIDEKTSTTSRQMDILIRLNFFDEFGNQGKLLDIYSEFHKGKNKYNKKLKDETKAKRLIILKEMESTTEDRVIPVCEQIMFEKDVLGYVTSSFPNENKGYGVILEVDTKYSPRINIYMLKAGKEIVYKVSREDFYRFEERIFQVGDLIEILSGKHKPKSKKIDGKYVPQKETEPWITDWRIVERANQ